MGSRLLRCLLDLKTWRRRGSSLWFIMFFFFKYKHTHTAENSLSASIIIDDRMPLAAGGMVCGPHNVGHGYRYRVWWWCTGLITGLHWRKSIQPFSHLSFLTRSPLVPLSCGRGIRPSEEEIGGFPLYFFSACWSVAPFAGHWGLSPCPHIQKCAHTPPCIALLWRSL